jgi:hypothetical protein
LLSLTAGRRFQNIEKAKPEELSDETDWTHGKEDLNEKESGNFVEDNALRVFAVPEATEETADRE